MTLRKSGRTVAAAICGGRGSQLNRLTFQPRLPQLAATVRGGRGSQLGLCHLRQGREHWRPSFAVVEDRNFTCAASSKPMMNWRPPFASAGDRNDYGEWTARDMKAWRPPFAVAEDRNIWYVSASVALLLLTAAVRGGRGSQPDHLPGRDGDRTADRNSMSFAPCNGRSAARGRRLRRPRIATAQSDPLASRPTPWRPSVTTAEDRNWTNLGKGQPETLLGGCRARPPTIATSTV
jgi:hypothetical protein